MTQMQVIDQATSEIAKKNNKQENEVTSFEVANFLAKQIVGQKLPIHGVVKSLPNDEDVKAHIDTLPYYGTCTTEYNEGFEDGVKWLKEQIDK